ncbi:MAG TPA: hypothetical protein VN875_00835 [Candidatus Binatus sp.]|jgi:hypothetical protein|nr:hypothetical protein [Candidatus Binatus sp.]
MPKLIALDDAELSDWVMTLGEERSGKFLCALAEAVMKADAEDYSVIRPALVSLKTKYGRRSSDAEEIGDVISGRGRPSRVPRCERRNHELYNAP